MNTTVEQLRAAKALEDYAREMSIMLGNVLGGGSEWFTRVNDEFYICPKIAGAELQRRKTDAQITKKALFRANTRFAEQSEVQDA